VALRDARLDVFDDLVDVDLLRLAVRATALRLRRRTPLAAAAPVLAAPAAVEVLSPPLIWMLVCCHVNR